tara:strand:+ start:138 stop:542 length:405 start_codon:yes stop_codon:yes gene_type:complete
MTRENVGLSIYFDNRMLRILLLGAISGFPWVIIGSALSLWLKDYELSRSTIGWAGLIFSVYAINFIWAPIIDRVKIPILDTKNWPQEIVDHFFTSNNTGMSIYLDNSQSCYKFRINYFTWIIDSYFLGISRYNN